MVPKLEWQSCWRLAKREGRCSTTKGNKRVPPINSYDTQRKSNISISPLNTKDKPSRLSCIYWKCRKKICQFSLNLLWKWALLSVEGGGWAFQGLTRLGLSFVTNVTAPSSRQRPNHDTTKKDPRNSFLPSCDFGGLLSSMSHHSSC